MGNINKTAYYACHIDNSTDTGNYLSFKPVSLKEKSFSFDIWFFIDGISHTIISQENGFSFGIEEDLITFSHPAIGKKSVRSDIVKFNKREWVNIFVTYGSTKLSFAINGVIINQINCPNIAFVSNELIRIGEGFTGYIRSFRLYSEVIKEVDFKKYLYQATYTNEMSYISAFIDCNTKDIQDISPNNIPVKASHACSIVDLVHIYMPSKGKYASLTNANHINPGAFDSQSFGIYIKTYIRPASSTNKKQVLFANGDFDEIDCLIIYTEYESSDTFKVICQLGNKTITSKKNVKGCEWVDIIVNYSDKTASLLLNAEEESYTLSEKYARKSKADVKIGNCFDANFPNEDFTCKHYISILGVFSKTLTRNDAEDFLKNHPFIFEDDLVALYGFNTGIPVENVLCMDLSLDKTDMRVVQRTTNEISTEAYKYRLNYTKKKVSSIATWQAETIYTVYTEYYTNMLNLTPAINEAEREIVLNYMANDSALIEENMDLFVSEKVTNKTISNSVSKLRMRRVSQFSEMVRPNTLANIAAGGSIAATSAAAVGTGGTGIASVTEFALLLMSVTIMEVLLKSVLDKIDDKPDDDDDNKTPLEVTELKLQYDPDNFKESAVRCRNYKGSIVSPEWTKTNKNNAVAIYIASELTTVKVKTTLEITDTSKSPKGTYQVKLMAYAKDSAKALFNYLEFNGTLSLGVNKDIVLIAKNLNFPKDNIYKSEMELVWNYEIDGKKNTTYNTKLTVYSIPVIPAPPVYMDKQVPQRNIAVEYLDVFCDILKEVSGVSLLTTNDNQVNATTVDLQKITRCIHESKVFQYTPDFQFFHFFKEENIHNAAGEIIGTYCIFDEKSFHETLIRRNLPIHMNCHVYAVVLSYWFSLVGVTSRVAIVEHLTATGQQSFLLLNPNVRFANNPDLRLDRFGYHAIVEVNPQLSIDNIDGKRYFDASCRSGVLILANLPFTNQNGLNINAADATSYRGRMFQIGEGAILTESQYINIILAP